MESMLHPAIELAIIQSSHEDRLYRAMVDRLECEHAVPRAPQGTRIGWVLGWIRRSAGRQQALQNK